MSFGPAPFFTEKLHVSRASIIKLVAFQSKQLDFPRSTQHVLIAIINFFFLQTQLDLYVTMQTFALVMETLVKQN